MYIIYFPILYIIKCTYYPSGHEARQYLQDPPPITNKPLQEILFVTDIPLKLVLLVTKKPLFYNLFYLLQTNLFHNLFYVTNSPF